MRDIEIINITKVSSEDKSHFKWTHDDLIMLITIYTAETNLFNCLHHALAVVIEGEVRAVRPRLHTRR